MVFSTPSGPSLSGCAVWIDGLSIDLAEHLEDDDSWWTEELAAQWHAVDFDYYAALQIGKTANLGAIYHAYRKEVKSCGDPRDLTWFSQTGARRAAKLRFWLTTEALLVLRDPEKRRIYDHCGIKALRQSESYSENSVFEADHFDFFDKYTEGEDPESREFLLMSGAGSSDDESEEDPMEHEQVVPARVPAIADIPRNRSITFPDSESEDGLDPAAIRQPAAPAANSNISVLRPLTKRRISKNNSTMRLSCREGVPRRPPRHLVSARLKWQFHKLRVIYRRLKEIRTS